MEVWQIVGFSGPCGQRKVELKAFTFVEEAVGFDAGICDYVCFGLCHSIGFSLCAFTSGDAYIYGCFEFLHSSRPFSSCWFCPAVDQSLRLLGRSATDGLVSS